MSPPALSEMDRFEQPINDSFESLWGFVLHERIDLFHRRRQSDEIEVDATQQHQFVRLRRGLQRLRFELREEKPIDRSDRPCGVLHRWRGVVLDRLPAPMLIASHGQIERLDLANRRDLLRPRCSHLDPLRQRRNLFRGELRLRRHLVHVAVVDRTDQQTFSRFARNNRRSRVPPLKQLGPRIHPQPSLRSLVTAAMTFETPRRQDRPDFLLKELDRGFVKGGFSGDARSSQQQAQQAEVADREKGQRWRSEFRQHRGLRNYVRWDELPVG